MADMTLFHYVPGRSFFHKADPRFKTGVMILMSLAVMCVKNLFGLGLLTILTAWAFRGSRLPLRRLVTEGRPVLCFCGLMFLVYSYTIPGHDPISRFLPGLTWEGLPLGLSFVWKFMLVFVAGLIFIGTTTSQSICEAVEALLRPVPFLPATRLATMIGLIFVLTPLLLDQTAEMLEAQAARGIFLNKNPLRRIRCLAIPLCARIIQRAEQLALAMEARCYSEERSRPVFRVTGSDWVWLLGMFALWLGLLM